MEYEQMTGTEDTRTRLDILENLVDAIDNEREGLQRVELDEIAHQVADEWPANNYNGRVVQWLMAGRPDLDDAPAVEWVTDARELIGADSYRSVNLAIHAMLGAVLYGVARAVIDDAIGYADDMDTARRNITQTMAAYRARVMTHDGHALTPPYQWTLSHTYDARAVVNVEPIT